MSSITQDLIGIAYKRLLEQLPALTKLKLVARLGIWPTLNPDHQVLCAVMKPQNRLGAHEINGADLDGKALVCDKQFLRSHAHQPIARNGCGNGCRLLEFADTQDVHRWCAKELSGKRRFRCFVKFLRRANLLDATILQEDNLVSH